MRCQNVSAKRLNKKIENRKRRTRLRSSQRFSAKLHDDMCIRNVYMDYDRRQDYIV